MVAKKDELYPVSFEIDYVPKHDRGTTFFRLILAIPILIILSLLMGGSGDGIVDEAGKEVTVNGGGIMAGLLAATALMILFRQRYPRWWFDFALELNRFSVRVGAYLFLLTDAYPSTVEKQSVHIDVPYPNVKEDLNKYLPLVKWFLAIPHYLVLLVLMICVFFITIVAWFAILFTGKYPKDLFDFVVGVGRWNFRVTAYAYLLTTDQYPPFSLK